MFKPNNTKGFLVAIDGPNGVGKSTLIEKIKIELETKNYQVYITKEPTNTELGNFTKKFAEHHSGISLACLVAADRYEHILTEILPKLDIGKIIITDRYILSSLILQGIDNVKNIVIMNLNSEIIKPDLQIAVFADEHILQKRLSERKVLTRFENGNQSYNELCFMKKGIECLRKANIEILEINNNNKLKENTIKIVSHIIKSWEGKRKRFVLLNSPIFRDSTEEDEQYLSPLGLGYIATYLEKSGINVNLIDCVKEKRSVSNIISLINKTCPDYLGINIFTQNYKLVKDIVENINARCEFFIGGPAVKSIYQEILQWNIREKLNIIIGDGEYIVPALVLGRCKQEPEIVQGNKYLYRVNNISDYFPNNISDIFMNRKYLKNEIITNHYGEKEIAIITSRGCIFDCAFCGGAKSLNRDVKIRIRTEKSIVKELKDIAKLYPDIQCVRILDDLFLRDAKSIDMANKIFSQFPKLNWRGMTHVLSLVKAIDKIKELRVGKCKELFIGIESGSQSVRRKINKAGELDDIIRVSREILSCGIDLKAYFIYGFPHETKEDFQKTFELAYKLKEISRNTAGIFRTSVFQFRPYHGTQLYNEIIEDTGIIHDCKINTSISHFAGRTQFNSDFGNYSEESDEVLNEYIIKTQKLAGGNL